MWKYLIIICLCFKFLSCHFDDWKTNTSSVNASANTVENFVNLSEVFVVIRPLGLAQIDFKSTTNYPDSNNVSTIDSKIYLWGRLGYSESYLKLAHPHWLQYEPPPAIAQHFLATLYIIIMMVGCIGNALVIFMFIKCKSLRTAANILVTNLAISDMLMLMKMPVFILNSFYENDFSGSIGCSIYGFLGGLSGTVSIMTLASISIDRYYVVVYPLQRAKATLRARVCVLLVWLYGLAFASVPLLGTKAGRYVPEGYLTSCSFEYLVDDNTKRSFIFGYFCAAWVLPFLIICGCYSRIIKVVLQARHMSIGKPTNGAGGHGTGESGRHVKDEEQKKTEIRLALIVLSIIGLWFAAWTPYATVALLGISGNKHLVTPLGSMIPALFCKTAACLDPWVYAITNQKFREELLIICPIFKSNNNKNKGRKEIQSTDGQLDTTIATIKRDDSDEEVEEVIIMTEFNRNRKGKAKETPTSSVPGTPLEKMQSRLEKKNSFTQSTAAWVLKPNFSNRTNSLRSLARTWNRSKDSTTDENDNI